MYKGDVTYADLGSVDSIAHIQRGWRPVIILDVFQDCCAVIPFTSQTKKTLPTHVNIVGGTIPRLKRDSVVLCENCTTISQDCLDLFNEPYNLCEEHPEIWGRIVDKLSMQLSRKFDGVQNVKKEQRRGSILRVVNVEHPVIVLSNEMNNVHSNNLTVMELPGISPCSHKGYDIREECFRIKHVALINSAQSNVVECIGYTGKKIANYIEKQIIEILRR